MQRAVSGRRGRRREGARPTPPNSPLADDAGALIDRVNRCLMAGTMGTQQRQEIRDAVNAIAVSAPNGAANRVYTAVLLTMASPEYLVQK